MKLYASLVAACMLLPASLMAQSQIKVIDQHGRAVSQAVISLPTELTQTNAGTSVMDQVNKQFSPQVLIIEKGQSVHFPNSDNIRHHVYSFSKAKPFEIKLYSGTPTEPVEFNHSGVVVLGCNIHDAMVGYIYVSDKAISVLTDAEGIAQFEQTQLPESVKVWHSALSASASERIDYQLEQTNQAGQWIVRLELIEKIKTKENQKKSFRSRFY